MASGVSVEDDCLQIYEEIKLKKTYKYVMFGMKDNDKKIGILKKAPIGTSYDDFLADLKEAADNEDCRYAIYDFDYNVMRSGTASLQNKLLFFVWCPETARIKRKMLYSSSKDALKKKLQGIHAEIQCTGFDEVEHDYVLERVMDKQRN